MKREWKPRLIAHRGTPVLLPENTLAGFRRAVEDGADVIETDLWVTADGVIVCHHDQTLDRVTDRTGAIPDLCLEEVRVARVSGSEYGRFDTTEPIPTLSELLAAVPARIGLALELKDPRLGEPAHVASLCEIITARVDAGSVMLLSFDEDLLWQVRRRKPRVWIGKIEEYQPVPQFRGNGIGTTPQAMAANPDYMPTARAQGLWVCPLDPQPEPRLDWYSQLDVDALLTDDVATTKAALGRSLGSGAGG